MEKPGTDLMSQVFDAFLKRVENDDLFEATSKKRVREFCKEKRKLSAEEIFEALFGEDELE